MSEKQNLKDKFLKKFRKNKNEEQEIIDVVVEETVTEEKDSKASKIKQRVSNTSNKVRENVAGFSTKTKENISKMNDKAKERISNQAQLTTDALKNALDTNTGKAKALLHDKERIEHFLMRLERKFKKFPGIGQELSYIPAMICLVKDYVDGEYRDIPLGSIIGIISAFVYFMSPFNLIPNAIPILGLTDDIALIAYVWRLVGDDVKEYEAWRKANHKEVL
ncbi:MAG: DUF1232 domain-containing protein [Erysipelotrichaceae bacterium]|nr:DUF1232 domain-containing protein [Erysipelotrichaceae bacterium]